jgi:F-type H+-transporting ATPase subunit delta
MATAGVVGIRYAHAFASVAASNGLDVAAAKLQMQAFSALLDSSRELKEILENPSIPSDQKLSVLDALAVRLGMMREVRNFVAVIMDHQRLNELKEIVAAYELVADEDSGVAEAEVTSAFDLNADDRKELEAQVARLAGSKVRVAYKQDKALLGGAVVKIGSTVYDGSVRGQLEQLKQTLVNA